MNTLSPETPLRNVLLTGGVLRAGLGFEGEILSGMDAALLAGKEHAEAMDNSIQYDFTIQNLGECTIPSPVTSVISPRMKKGFFLAFISISTTNSSHRTDALFPLEVAGPREKIFFDPSKTKAAIVTCGGLCPGINDVIRTLVMELHHRYGVRNIVGIKYGFQGLIPKYGHPIMELTPEIVKDIHTRSVGVSFLLRADDRISTRW